MMRRAPRDTTFSMPPIEAVQQLPAPPVLPRQAMWFFVVSPPLLAFLFDPACVMEPFHVVRALATLLFYTVVTGISVHYAFEWLARRLKSASLALRVPAHALVTTAVVVAVTLPQLPLITFVYPEAIGKELTILWRGVLVSFVYLTIASFIGHLQRVAVKERLRAHEERSAALESRLAALQAQMQPHFLFNSLNVCAGLVHADPELAEQTLDRLAGFLRYALESTEHRFVPIEDELAAVDSYLEVQRQRFGDRLRYEVRLAPEAEGSSIPPMLLQPLVENAILHGLRERTSGGAVRVEATANDGELHIVVEDDGVGPGASTHRGTGFGQKNVRERLRIVYGEGARLETGPSTSGGYRCELVLPEGGAR